MIQLFYILPYINIELKKLSICSEHKELLFWITPAKLNMVCVFNSNKKNFHFLDNL